MEEASCEPRASVNSLETLGVFFIERDKVDCIKNKTLYRIQISLSRNFKEEASMELRLQNGTPEKECRYVVI